MMTDFVLSSAEGIARSKISGLPTSSTDNTLPRFDGTGGALQSSSVSISDTGVMSGLADGSASTDAITKGYVDSRMPTGSVLAFAGSSAPAGWLLCYGQAVSRATYAGLYAVIGTTYGTGDGSTTFNLPDLRGRTVAGLDNMGGSDAGRLSWQNVLGTVGVSSTTVDSGEEKHTLSAAESGVPAHSHGITDPGHNHQLYYITSAGGAFAPNYAGGTISPAAAATMNGVTGITVNNNTAAAASAAHNNMQPTMLLNQIIRT